MELITIKSIELTNYRQFKNEKIETKHNSKKPFTIIEGKNGFGKSNILNAVTWCFYGIEEHLKTQNDKEAEPIPNTHVINELDDGDRKPSSVKIILQKGKRDISIQRNLWFGKRNGKYYQDNESQLIILQQDPKGNWEKHPFPTYRVNQILPHIVSKFFFFDGEQLRKFFENINPKKVKDSIFDISQLFLIEYAIQNLEKILRDYRTTNKNLDPELKGIKSEIDFYEKNIPNLEKECTNKEQQVDLARGNLEILDNNMKMSNIELVKELTSNRDGLQTDIENLNEDIDQIEKEIKDYVMENSQYVLAMDSINETSELISNLSLEGVLPRKIEDTFIRDLLDVKKKCICGTSLESGKAREELLKMLKDRKIKEGVSKEANELRYDLRSIKKNTKDFHSIINKKLDRKAQKEELKENKEKELKEISIKLGTFEHVKNEDVVLQENERKKLLEIIEEESKKLGAMKREIEDFKRSMKEKEDEYDKKENEKTKNQKLSAKKAFVKNGKEILENTKEKLMSELREEIEINTKSYFKKLVTAKVSGELKIDDDYRISLEKQGFSALKSLSVGETLLLGLAFMGALRKVSGFVAPLIIDTPLAPIDEEYRSNLISFLSEALEDTQIILLMKDTENTQQVKESLLPHTFIMKKLSHDRITGCSEVIDYE